MRIALISDIHSNLPAFDSAIADIEKREITHIYCLGDLVGYNVWSNEIIQKITKRKIPTIAGNHDIKVEKLVISPVDLSITGKDYSYHIIEDDNRQYLRTLPKNIRLEIQMSDKKLNIVLVHGSPRSVNEYLSEDLEEAYLAELIKETNADVLCFGHTHIPYQRTINIDNTTAKLINTGSIGKPKDGDPKGGYVILTINEKSPLSLYGSIEVEFIRFHYDVEQAAIAIENSPLPNELADQLRHAY